MKKMYQYALCFFVGIQVGVCFGAEGVGEVDDRSLVDRGFMDRNEISRPVVCQRKVILSGFEQSENVLFSVTL